jgi:hypothetical protein
MVACRTVVPFGAVVMRGMMPMLGGFDVLLYQGPAAAVPHDLLIRHAVALADRPFRKVRGWMIVVLASMVLMGRLMVLMTSVMVLMGRVMLLMSSVMVLTGGMMVIVGGVMACRRRMIV